MNVLGIDIGGSGIKGAPIDTNTGVLLAERFRIPTPDPSAPQPVADVIANVMRRPCCTAGSKAWRRSVVPYR